MNWKAILGYVSSIGGGIAAHGMGMPWYVSLITSVVGTIAAHYAPQPGNK